MKKFRQRKAFTIVEISIVIAVIAILSAVMIPTISGIVQRAHKAADEQTAATLTTQLSLYEVNNVINDVEDIRVAIGDDVLGTLEPKSAKQGYHYWYDTKAKSIVLKTCSEVEKSNDEYDLLAFSSVEHSDVANVSSGSTVSAVSKVSPVATAGDDFKTKYEKENSFRLIGYFYILDNDGTIGKVLKEMDECVEDNDIDSLREKISELYEEIDGETVHQTVAQKIIDRIGDNSKITDFNIEAEGEGIVRAADTIYVPYNVNNIKLSISIDETDTGVIPTKKTNWVADNALVSIDGDGNVAFNPLDANSSVTITATPDALANDTSPKTITITVVKPSNFYFTLAGSEYDMSSEEGEDNVVINYNNKESSSFKFEDLEVKLSSNIGVTCDQTVSIETAGSELFTISKSGNDYALNVNALDSYENKTQQFVVKVGSALTKTFTVTVIDISSEPYQVKAPFVTNSFLYRVGNVNEVLLSTFFYSENPDNQTLYIYDISKSAGSTNAPIGATAGFTATVNGESSTKGEWVIDKDEWESTAIQFTGTGTTMLKLGEVSVVLEVVNGKNYFEEQTVASTNGTNIVLLGNVVIASGGKVDVKNASLFGNDFTFNVSAGNYSGSTGVAYNYVVSLSNATLDNVRIIGKNFTSFSITKDDADNVCNVYSSGNNVISNSYISGCAAPVRINGGTLELVKTTLSGGSFANVDIRNGNIILDNVTTINQHGVAGKPASEGSIGLGVAVWYEQVSGCKITIKNNLTQYNYVTKDEIKNIGFSTSVFSASDIANAMFANSNEAFIYEDDNGSKWVNTGIISLIDSVNSNNFVVSDFTNASTYLGQTVTFSALGQTKAGYLYSLKRDNVSLSNPGIYVSGGQGDIIPSSSINNSKNEVIQTEGSNEYCTIDGDEITISFDLGASKDFKLEEFITASKFGKNLTLTDTYLDGSAVTNGDTLTLDAEGEYVLKFVFNDPYNYNVDGTTRVEKYEKYVYLTVKEVIPEAKNATFDFNGNGYKVELINGVYYVMPNVTATSGTVGSKTVSGTTVYCPIVSCSASNNKTTQTSGTTWYMLFPVFDGVVTITDYADGGIGDAVTYNSSTTTLPAGLAAKNPTTTFQYASASTAPETPSVYSNKLCYTSPACEGVNRNAYNIYAEYVYTDNKGTEFHYFVRYDTPEIKNNSCVTGDTLITLADGSQKEIQYVTYDDQLLVWNHYTGAYDVVPAAIIFEHGYDKNMLIKLNFSDGTQVKVINLHQFLDVDLGKYVSIDATTVAQYVGHSFAKQDGNGYTTVTLDSYEISEEYIEAYGIISAVHYNILVEGMFSTDFMNKDYNLFNYFTIGEGIVYDADVMQEDIEKYGLYTYEEFADYLTYEQFVGFNVQFFKISVGKGLYTYEGILDLIDEYLNV